MTNTSTLKSITPRETIALSEIQVPHIFLQTTPRREKMDQKKAYLQQHGRLEKPLIVHPDTKQLIDGWASYLVAKELGEKRVEVQYGTKKRSQSAKRKKSHADVKIPYAVRQAVWAAEDGRCEACRRPMDRRIAQFCQINPMKKNDWSIENLHLVCLDCKDGKPDLLHHISMSKQVVKELAERIDLSEQETAELIPDLLQQNGVILTAWTESRIYWLPGIGVFHVNIEQPIPEVVKIERIYTTPRVKVKPQACTRRLPKPKIFAKK
jgi:hypothetical protein